MRALPAAVTSILAARQQIGEHRPTYEVNITGAPDEVYNFNETYYGTAANWKRPQSDSTMWMSFAKCKNGKIICLYGGSTAAGGITQGYAGDLDAFLNNNSLSDHVTIWTDRPYIRGTVFNEDSGELYLHVTWYTALSGNLRTYYSIIYKSTSGNGVDTLGSHDWQQYGVVSEVAQASTGDAVGASGQVMPTGRPLVLSGGRWVLPAVFYSDHFGMCGKASIYTSDDGGVTWTHRVTFAPATAEAGDNTHQARVIAEYNGAIYHFQRNQYSNGNIRLYKSTNSGTTWAQVYFVTGEGAGRIGQMAASFFSDSDYIYVLGATATAALNGLRRTTTPDTVDAWTLLWDVNFISTPMDSFVAIIDNRLVFQVRHKVISYGITTYPLYVKRIHISRNRGMSANLDLLLDNKDGRYSPDKAGSTWNGILKPNVQVEVEQGYGANLIHTFTGLLNDVEMTSFPQEMRLTAQDNLKRALRQIVDGQGSRTLTYSGQTPEAIVSALATLAGITVAETDVSGLTLDSVTFTEESYGDAMAKMADIALFELFCDEDGELHFVKDEQTDMPTPSYQFVEGTDLIRLGYVISDYDIYKTVIVRGQGGVEATADFTAPIGYGMNVIDEKVLVIDAHEATTNAQCQAIANRAVSKMLTRARVVNFACVAVPWLQIGDFIQVTEASSTISEIYRITGIEITQQTTGRELFAMQIECYWYGHGLTIVHVPVAGATAAALAPTIVTA